MKNNRLQREAGRFVTPIRIDSAFADIFLFILFSECGIVNGVLGRT